MSQRGWVRPFLGLLSLEIVLIVIRYAETFFRHRILILLPLVLALAVSLSYEAVQPDSYRSTATLWFDSPTTGAATPAVPTSDTRPSAEEVSVIQELLGTSEFSLAVVHRGPLAKYIADHPHWQSGLAAFPGLDKAFGPSGQSVDERAVSVLAASVSVAATGPQVVMLTVSGPTADVARGTASALVNQFTDEVLAGRKGKAQAAVAYDTAILQSAQQQLSDAQKALSAYEADHKGATLDIDPTLSSLRTGLDLASQRYDSALAQYNQAALDLQHVADTSGFHVIDQPTLPVRPIGVKKRMLLTGLAGLVVGLTVSIAVLVALTVLDRTARRPEDLEQALNVEVIGTIRRYRQPRQRPQGRKRHGRERHSVAIIN
jgi:uncharacterized protein involved in exopolysaccharide biosynthesis